MDNHPVLVTFVIISDVIMYVTLLLHIRLLHVLVRPSKGVALDGSFLTLMINTTIVNLLYSIDFCLVQCPAATGVFYKFYKEIGQVASKPAMIKATTLVWMGSAFHLVLAFSRFTAISMPTKHGRSWRFLPHICGALWTLTFLISIPLILPGSTTYLPGTNIFGIPHIEFTFLGNYFLIYTLGLSGIGAAIEIITILCYSGMVAGFRKFIYGTKSTEVSKMKLGVIRTTVAAMCTSTGKSMVTPLEFTSVFGLLNTINNILTPWVLLFAFPNVRRSIFTARIFPDNRIASTTHSARGPITKSIVSKEALSVNVTRF